MAQSENLTPIQARFLAEMMTTRTITEACKKAGVSRRVADRWRQLPAFQSAIADREGEILDEITRSTMALLAPAQAVLVRTMADPDVSAGVRVRAATALIEFCMRLIDVRTIERRLSALESQNEQA